MKKLLVALFILSAISLPAFATTVERLSLDDMVKKAESIIHGRVRSAHTHWSADGRLILTTYTIDVEETMKGQPARTVDLTTIGGRIGDLELYVAGMPAFRTGEDAVVFVEKSAGLSVVVGLTQGKFVVENGEVTNDLSSLSFPDGREGVPLKMRLDDFKQQIQNRLH
jgi:hypothetical protein